VYGYVELHGHRGARGLRPENTLPALMHALELGVDVLEFDLVMSADGELVLCHDLIVSDVTSADTAPAAEGAPYVGKPVISLTLPQLHTLEVGRRRPRCPEDPFAATQVPVPGLRMPTLGAALDLIEALGAGHVRLNLDLKTDPTRPDLSADPRRLTDLVVAELDRRGLLRRSSILAFDWRILEIVRPLGIPRYALVEKPTMSPEWMNGIHLDDFGGSLVEAARAAGATALSPEWVLIDHEVMEQARRHGMPVIAWTVNDVAEAGRLIDLGVSGIVTDYPDRMRPLWRSRGFPLPAPLSRCCCCC